VSAYRIRSVLLLTLAGLSSGLLTITLEYLLGFSDPYLVYPGLSFGLLISAYFILNEGVRWAWRIIGFIAASVGAFQLSVISGLVFGADTVGGCIGAALVFNAAVFTFRSREFNWTSVARCLLGSLAGGLLAKIGWDAGPAMGVAVLRALENFRGPSLEPFHEAVLHNLPQFLSLYLVWHTGAAFVLGLLLSRDSADSAGDVWPFSDSEASAISSRQR
jgi:hypothetical protein